MTTMRRIVRLVMGLGLLTVILAPTAGGGAAAAGAGQAGKPAQLERRGRLLYQQACGSCHGPDPNGPSVYPTVPSLRDVGGAAAVDWALRTGRMPWRSAEGPALPGTPRFGAADIRALTVYIGRAVGDPTIPSVDPARGDVQRGRDLYASSCAACHGASGNGVRWAGSTSLPRSTT